jgi:2-dehydro-3-deoxygalactonokinase
MIAVDWGTSSFRAYRLAADGRIEKRREAPLGILSVAAHDFAAALEGQVGDWISAGEAPIVMSGMIGSRQGWQEVPYAACPAGFDAVARGMKRVHWGKDRSAFIAPGVTCFDSSGVPDVMRGEEVQILGALEEIASNNALICLPGTHSKWARVSDGRIVSFSTHMTGEIYALLREHSILSRLMTHDVPAPHFFDQGVRRAREAGGLLHHLFGVRSLGLFEQIPATGLPSYLSGIVIGHELASAAPEAEAVNLLGSPQLTALYTSALRAAGIASRVLDSDAVAHGLFRLSSNLPRSCN